MRERVPFYIAGMEPPRNVSPDPLLQFLFPAPRPRPYPPLGARVVIYVERGWEAQTLSPFSWVALLPLAPLDISLVSPAAPKGERGRCLGSLSSPLRKRDYPASCLLLFLSLFSVSSSSSSSSYNIAADLDSLGEGVGRHFAAAGGGGEEKRAGRWWFGAGGNIWQPGAIYRTYLTVAQCNCGTNPYHLKSLFD